jgi:hypothetical protein
LLADRWLLWALWQNHRGTFDRQLADPDPAVLSVVWGATHGVEFLDQVRWEHDALARHPLGSRVEVDQ